MIDSFNYSIIPIFRLLKKSLDNVSCNASPMQLIHRILERKKNIMLSRTLQGRPHLRGVVLKYIHKTKKANSAIRKIAKYD